MDEYVSSGAADDGFALATLFASRDAYVEVHREVFGGPLTALLRALRVKAQPNYAALAQHLHAVAQDLETVRPYFSVRAHMSTPMPPGLDLYCVATLEAVTALQELLEETAATGSPGRVADLTMARYQAAATRFGAVGDVLARH